MADYTEPYAETIPIPEISDASADQEVGTNAEPYDETIPAPSLTDAAADQQVGTNAEDYNETIPVPTESYTNDPECVIADFEADETIILLDDTVNFTDLSAGSPDEWDWDFGDGTAHGTTQNPSHQYTEGGAYTVVLIASRTDAASSSTHTETKTAYIQVALDCQFSGTPLSGEAPLTVQFTDESLGSVESWLWTFGDGKTSVLENPSHEYTTGGFKTVTLTVTARGISDTLIKENYVNIAGSVSIAMADELGLRLEDPKSERFTPAGKYIMLNKAQIQLMNLLDKMYLTELQSVETEKSLTDNYLAFSSLNSGLGIYKGREGIERVRVRIGGTADPIDCIEIEYEDELQELSNSYFAYSDERPYYYIHLEKIYVLVKTYTGTTVDVYYYGFPSGMTNENDPDLNETFQDLIITFAEAMGWGMDNKLDRKASALKHAQRHINMLNSLRPFFDEGGELNYGNYLAR